MSSHPPVQPSVSPAGPPEEPSGPSALRRRTVLGGGAAAGVLAAAGYTAAPASAHERRSGHGKPETVRITIMGTTDLHGSALNWDYFKDAEYDDSKHEDIGLA
ncbi:MAG TPA: hypothetical protein VHO27_00105, partial [Angustibacter sp.]|nr:hypothetical protein [Angustibacter sp.]